MKTCECGCGYPVFSHGYSKAHQFKRTDEKYLKAQKKAREKRFTPHKKMDEKKTPIEYSFGYESQIIMFWKLWNKVDISGQGIVCPFTGEKLNRFNNTNRFWSCFAHVLPKGRYPYFKLNPDNIRIVYPRFHEIIDRGTLKERSFYPEWKWDEWDRLVIEMKEKYDQFKRDNLLP